MYFFLDGETRNAIFIVIMLSEWAIEMYKNLFHKLKYVKLIIMFVKLDLHGKGVRII